MGRLRFDFEKMKERMTNGGIEKASVSQMLQEIKEIRVYEWEVEICFDPFKIADLSDNQVVDEELTAKQIAAIMGRSRPMIINRMEELSKNGYIRFAGKGGSGTWEILKELPDKEISIKTGGL